MIKQILDTIANEPSTNQKMVLLSQHKDNELLKRVLYMACSKRIKFYIKEIPNYNSQVPSLSLEGALNLIESHICSRYKTGNDAIQELSELLSYSSLSDAYVIERIISKDLKIGMGTENINKVFPKLIETTPYMGAQPFNAEKAKSLFKNIDYRYNYCFVDVKMDGRYNNAIIRNGEVECESRQGEKVILDNAKFIQELSTLPDCVLNGELTIQDEPNRYKANGIVMSLIDICSKRGFRTEQENKKKISKFFQENGCSVEEMLDRVVYTVWDTITIDEYFKGKSDIPYCLRWGRVLFLLKDSKMVIPVEKRAVFSYESALKFFQSCLNRGLEGSILKSSDGIWKDGKPSYQIKMKLEMDMDLEIVGFNYGTKGTKNEHVISSLVCQSKDGLLTAEPGGMDEKTMKYITDNQDLLKGKIVDVECAGVSINKAGEYSLLHPRIGKLKFRDDKTIADSLEEILENEKMCKGLI
jgi:hypothetical protein